MISFEKTFAITTLVLSFGSVFLNSLPNTAQTPGKTFQQIVADNASQEWIDFNKPNKPVVKSLQEVDALGKNPLEYARCDTINKYWAVVPAASQPPKGDTCAFNTPPTPQGTGQVSKWDGFPWSAAFVSYIMNRSGAGKAFKGSASHATYIIDSVKNKDEQNYPFRGYAINMEKPEIGDIICAPRGKDNTLKYSDVIKTSSFQSHCDIVVAKNAKSIEVIGGNVGDTVSKTIVSLDAQGYIQVTAPDFRPWFVVIKNTFRP